MKRYKVMAYLLSSGLWNASGPVELETILGHSDAELEAELKNWQTEYDNQFRRFPYRFDWERFNRTGEELTERIRKKLPAGTDIFYEPSDDREFFSPDECCNSELPESAPERLGILQERKRALMYSTP